MSFPVTPAADPDAWIAVFALEVAAAGASRGTFSGYRHNQHPAILSRDQLVARLANADKPVILRFSVDGTVLHVLSKPVTLPFDADIEPFFFRSLNERHPDIDNLTVACFGGGHLMRVTVRAFHQFERAYILDFPFGIQEDTVREPPQGLSPKQLQGVVAIAEFSGGRGGGWTITVDNKPPGLSPN